MVCADYLMKQPADGYNLMWFTGDSTIAMAKDPQKFSFTMKDFVFIGYFCYAPHVLAVSKASPFNTIEDFIENVKKHPSEMTLGTSGIGSNPHLSLEMFMKETGTKLINVPFPSGNAATCGYAGPTCHMHYSIMGDPHSLPPGWNCAGFGSL